MNRAFKEAMERTMPQATTMIDKLLQGRLSSDSSRPLCCPHCGEVLLCSESRGAHCASLCVYNAGVLAKSGGNDNE